MAAKAKKKTTKLTAKTKAKSPKTKTVKFKYIFSKDYNPTYANGAHGGITSRGEIAINFFLERSGVPNSETFALKSGGEIGNIIERDPPSTPPKIVRFVDTGVVLNYESAKRIHEWLGEHIEQLEKGRDDHEH